MQQVTVDAARWLRDSEGAWLAFRVNSDKTAMDVCDSLQDGKPYTVTVKRRGRSLDANAYFWTLVNRLADRLQTDPNEIYRAYIPDVGGNYEVVPVREDRIAVWEKVWCSGHVGRMIEDLGPCRNTKGYHNIRSYIASSDYDTAQMSRLIELVVADCRQLGIETMTPRELEALVSRWGEVGP
jgi:hypothetical protein